MTGDVITITKTFYDGEHAYEIKSFLRFKIFKNDGPFVHSRLLDILKTGDMTRNHVWLPRNIREVSTVTSTEAAIIYQLYIKFIVVIVFIIMI
jgi:hypothetical protein